MKSTYAWFAILFGSIVLNASQANAQQVYAQNGTLYILGTEDGEEIKLRPRGTNDLVVFFDNSPHVSGGQPWVSLSGIHTVRVEAGAGDDDLVLEKSGAIDLFDAVDHIQLIGEAGDDVLDPGFIFAGSGQSLLLVGDVERRIAFPWYFDARRADTVVRYFTFFDGYTSLRTPSLADYYRKQDGDRTRWVYAGSSLGGN